jgi:hypothetical protein
VTCAGPGPSRRSVLGASLMIANLPGLAAASDARLPDTEVTQHRGMSAYLIDATRRYRHAVLGDDIEAGGFAVEWRGQRLTFRLPGDAVFEDRRVRLADLDGDGRPEAIVVKAYLDRGAALAVYRILDDRIETMAEGPAIGQPNRWLNPVGVAGFSDGREPLIAAVVTPHLAGSLRLYRHAGAALVEVARIDGYTNHIIGSRDLDLGRIADVDGDGVPEVVLPTLDRTTLVAISFRDGARVVRKADLPGRMTALIAVRGAQADVAIEGKGRSTVTLRA